MTPEQEASSRALEAAADYFHSRKKTNMSWELRQIYNELAELRRDRDRLRSALRQWCRATEGGWALVDAITATNALKVFEGEDADAEAVISASKGDPKP